MAGRRDTVSDAEILRFFTESNDPFLSTVEVADFLGFSNEGARKRLYDLADEGYLDYKRVGRSPAWWLTEKGVEYLRDEESSNE